MTNRIHMKHIHNIKKRVLIAHQSTIPHYRIPFYNTLESLRPNEWCFDVVFDRTELKNKQFYKGTLDVNQFKFPLLEVRTITFKAFGKKIIYQTFWRKAANYDLIIVENAVNNLTYPLSQLHQLTGKKLVYWGHGKDRSIEHPSIDKQISEKVKLFLAHKADGFFAYTPGIRSFLVDHGIREEKIFTLNNTIDINAQRDAFNKHHPYRTKIRQDMDLEGKKVLLFVGRFTENRRMNFLLRSFSVLCDMDPDFHLLLVGSGGDAYPLEKLKHVSYFGTIVELDKLAPLYVASDVFVFPGAVGLGPLQALCYDLPVITIDSPTHGPEIEYLTTDNSLILKHNTSEKEFATVIYNLFIPDRHRIDELRSTTWPSIQHLTIDGMARFFIEGVNSILLP